MRFEDLEVWKRSTRLTAAIYKHFRDLRDFGYRDQITRSALSVPSNVAEGFERESTAETLRFFVYAKGSCGELRTQIHVGLEIGYIDSATGATWLDETREISAMLVGLMRSVERSS